MTDSFKVYRSFAARDRGSRRYVVDVLPYRQVRGSTKAIMEIVFSDMGCEEIGLGNNQYDNADQDVLWLSSLLYWDKLGMTLMPVSRHYEAIYFNSDKEAYEFAERLEAQYLLAMLKNNRYDDGVTTGPLVHNG